MEIVEVEWEDSQTTHDWHGEDVPAWKPAVVRSVGYLQRDDDSAVVLVAEQTIGEPAPGTAVARYGCTTAIPRSAVRKMTKLGPKRGK